VANGVKSAGIAIVVLTIAAQAAGKSVIRKIWSFFLNLQILIMVFVTNYNRYPANVTMIFNTLQDMLEIKAIPKD
jgi:hypothetical protein